MPASMPWRSTSMAERRLPDWPRSMSDDLAAAYTGVSVTTFRAEVAAGRAPAPIRLTLKRIAWLREDLDGWLDRLAGRVAASPPDSHDWQGALKRNGARETATR